MKAYRNTLHVGKFTQLTRKVYTQSEGLKSNNITCMSFDRNGKLFVGTDCGLSFLDGESFKSFEIGIKNAPVSMIYFNADNTLFVGTGNLLLGFDGKKKVYEEKFRCEVVDVKTDLDGYVWILTKHDLFKREKGSKENLIEIGVPGEGRCLAVYKDNKVYVGSKGNGLNALAGKRWHWSELTTDVTGLISNNVTSLYIDPAGDIWLGTDKGVCVYDDNSYWVDNSRVAGLPKADITGMAVAENGDKYFSTTTGLIHQHNGVLSYYGYKRWLPSPHATGVAVSPSGDICVSTDKGLSVITPEVISLEEKAKRLREFTEKYNVRKDGYCLSRYLDHEGVVSEDEGYIECSDNDGMWTGLYTAALCYEYACTKDEKVRELAHRNLLAMVKLTQITGIEGFVARAIRYPDERGYHTGNRNEWHDTKDKDGNELEWLGETSSDEIVGHFYCYTTYYDLVADEEEKELIRKTCSGILDHIIDNDFHLIDTDGKPTTWANWNPALLNNDNKWIYEKGTNTLQILAFLKAGYHMTGNERYDKVFNDLVSKHHYAMNMMQYRILDGHLLHIDDNHDFLMTNLIMRYVDDPQLRSLFTMGLTYHFNDEKAERNAFFNFTYGNVTGEHCDIENAVDELVDYPMDHVAWPLYNSHRQDLVWDMSPAEMGMIPQLFSPLTAHERKITSSDMNRFVADSGAQDVAAEQFETSDGPTAYTMFPDTGHDEGMTLDSCTNFTHPYWYARYYGLIKED